MFSLALSMIGVYSSFLLGWCVEQTQKGGQIDQSGKVLCFVDFNFKRTKTFGKKGQDLEQCVREGYDIKRKIIKWGSI